MTPHFQALFFPLCYFFCSATERERHMELGLSLGGGGGRDPSTTRALMFVGNAHNNNNQSRGLGFCMSFDDGDGRGNENRRVSASADPVQLDLLPLGPVQRSQASLHLGLPWQNENRGFDVNRVPSNEVVEDRVGACSPNSTLSSFQMDFSIHRSGGSRDSEPLGVEMDPERASSRASDDDDNGTRKKLRLSKDQSAFLEDSFKEHNTLNPKQKLELAKQLNLRPRQVEVWFQNRRARTKLKQTEVDCEYLKRCCETLTEENRRLQKELQELRALKACNPFYMQLPATTLTMCPSCERVATTTSTNKASAPGAGGSLAKPSGVSPFSHQAFVPKSTAT